MEKADLFTVIHKSIRTMIYDLGRTLQTSDFTDEAVIRQAGEEVRGFVRFLDEHAEHEDLRIFDLSGQTDLFHPDTREKHLANV